MIELTKDERIELERLRLCLTLACEIGQYWRNDWSNFDGRTLRNQMNVLRHVASGMMTADEYRERCGLLEKNYEKSI